MALADYDFRVTLTGQDPASALTGIALVITEDNLSGLSPVDFWTTVANGGGNIEVYADTALTTRLPIEVVSCVTGTSTAQIWVRKSTYELTDKTVTVCTLKNKSATQPVVTAAYGRNETWADYLAVLHLNDTSWTDSTGNGYTGVATGTPTITSLNHPFGGDWMELSSGVAEYLTLTSSGGMLDSLANAHVSAVVYKIGDQNGGIISNRNSSQSNNFQQLSSRSSSPAGFNYAFHDGSGEASSTASSATGISFLTQSWDNSNVNLYLDSVLASSASMVGDGQLITAKPMVVGSYFNFSASLSFTGYIGEVRVAAFEPAADQISIEHTNQSTTSTFWAASASDDPSAGGGAITVTESTQLINWSNQSPSINFTGVIAVQESTQSISFNTQDPTIEFTGSITIEESTQSINWATENPLIALTPPNTIVITESVRAIDWASQDPTVLFSGTINVTESTQSINMIATNPIVSFGTLWTDKAVITTTWTNSTISSTIWTDK